MLRSVSDLQGYKLVASDGDVGTVHDLYFDDERWAIRYLVADTGKWLPGRLVLISPMSLHQPDWDSRRIGVSLTREQVKNSPPIEAHKPVSRQQESELFDYYGLPYYWSGAGLWATGPYPAGPVPYTLMPVSPPLPPDERPRPASPRGGEDSHLRSAREVTGYHLQAEDGELGHVADFVVDDETWAIRYLIVDTSNWWFGKKVVIPPDWATDVDWINRRLHVDVNRQKVKQAPGFESVAQLNRDWEANYYTHHRRPPYWLASMLLAAALSFVGCGADAERDTTATGEPVRQREGALEVPTTPATGVRLAVAQTPTHGRYLADSQGRPLYARVGEQAGQRCTGACADEWPPLLASQPPAEAGEPAIDAALIGTVLRDDGTQQITYAGRPLYYRSDEYGPPQRTTIKDEYGTWSLLLPEGLPIERSD